MHLLPIKVISFIALAASALYGTLGVWSAASLLAGHNPNLAPDVNVLQSSLVQGALTNSFILGSITFGLIGFMGLAIIVALQSMEARFAPLKQQASNKMG